MVEGGFQQIQILVYIRIHWLQADEVIQKVIHLSNIEQSDKISFIIMFWLVILQKHVFDNNKDALKWWRGKGGRSRLYQFNIDKY